MPSECEERWRKSGQSWGCPMSDWRLATPSDPIGPRCQVTTHHWRLCSQSMHCHRSGHENAYETEEKKSCGNLPMTLRITETSDTNVNVRQQVETSNIKLPETVQPISAFFSLFSLLNSNCSRAAQQRQWSGAAPCRVLGSECAAPGDPNSSLWSAPCARSSRPGRDNVTTWQGSANMATRKRKREKSNGMNHDDGKNRDECGKNQLNF